MAGTEVLVNLTASLCSDAAMGFMAAKMPQIPSEFVVNFSNTSTAMVHPTC